MQRTKTGVKFDTEQEVRNFLRLEMNPEAIRARASKRKRIINYENPRTQYRVIMAGIARLETRKHREGKMLLTTITRCAMERDRLMRVMHNTNEPSAKYCIAEQIKSLDREEVYKHYMKEWGYNLKKLMEIEKRTLDAIGDKINLVSTPITVGETIKQKGI